MEALRRHPVRRRRPVAPGRANWFRLGRANGSILVMAAQHPAEPVRIDVDQWLLDLNDTLNSARQAWRRLNGVRGTEAAQAHADRVEADPDYAQVIEAMLADVRWWRGTVDEFIRTHPEHELLPAALQLPARVRGRDDLTTARERQVLDSWRFRVSEAADHLQRAKALTRALQDLTGADNEDEAFSIADDNIPLIDWTAFEEAVQNVEPADRGLDPLPFDHPSLSQMASWLVDGRTTLARATLRQAVQTEEQRNARPVLRRFQASLGFNVRRRDEAEVDEALTTLGYKPSTDRAIRAEQIRAALEADPEVINDFLRRARYTAERLKELTGATTMEDAVRKANAGLEHNQGYKPRPPAGVVIYSGGLPSLGKRR